MVQIIQNALRVEDFLETISDMYCSQKECSLFLQKPDLQNFDRYVRFPETPHTYQTIHATLALLMAREIVREVLSIEEIVLQFSTISKRPNNLDLRQYVPKGSSQKLFPQKVLAAVHKKPQKDLEDDLPAIGQKFKPLSKDLSSLTDKKYFQCGDFIDFGIPPQFLKYADSIFRPKLSNPLYQRQYSQENIELVQNLWDSKEGAYWRARNSEVNFVLFRFKLTAFSSF